MLIGHGNRFGTFDKSKLSPPQATIIYDLRIFILKQLFCLDKNNNSILANVQKKYIIGYCSNV